MDKQAQDARWERLSEREQAGWLENYKCNKEDGNKESMKIVEDLFGLHNLNPRPQIKTWEDVEEKGLVHADTGATYLVDIDKNHYSKKTCIKSLSNPTNSQTHRPRIWRYRE